MNDTKKTGKLATYSVIMILMIVIVIIFAAMADNREEVFQSQINETSRTNIEIQNELMIVKDENEGLKKQIEELQSKDSEYSRESEIMDKLSEIWNVYENGNEKDARAKLGEIDVENIPSNALAFYNAVKSCLD